MGHVQIVLFSMAFDPNGHATHWSAPSWLTETLGHSAQVDIRSSLYVPGGQLRHLVSFQNMPPVHTQRSEPASEDENAGYEEQISMCSLLYVLCKHGLQDPLVFSSHPHISPAGQLHDVLLFSDIAPVGHAVQLRAPSWLTEFSGQLLQVISVSFQNIPAGHEQ